MSQIDSITENQDLKIVDNFEVVYNLDIFVTEDLKECLILIKELSSVSETNSNFESIIERICERFDTIIGKWQTNPKLIETHLRKILDPIIDIISETQLNGSKFNASFRLIQRLVSCLGPKTVCRYFPTEVIWLTKLTNWCEDQNPSTSNGWQTRSNLLLWLSTSVKTPFHLRKFDSNDESICISERIYRLINIYLKESDKSRDSAALLSANFFSRPDIIEKQMLSRFIDDSLIQLNTHLGYIMALTVLFKVGKRTDVNPFSEKIIEMSSKLDTSKNELVSKWKIKLIGRSALALMTPRIAKWRYKRGKRLLSQNTSNQLLTKDHIMDCSQQKELIEDTEDMCDYSDIPQQFEVIIESLMNGLHDPNTIVRWSAAKYLSRLTNRLPQELASDVITHIIQLYEWKKSENCLHGCCLALAELSRRGLILTHQLTEVVTLVEKALLFDEIRGTISVGTNVRDAACFVCWSLSRAYDSNEIKKFVDKLAPILVCLACFDREVNCRRAASATIQEIVGRTQAFPHGFEVLVLTEFHSLANRNHCYLDIAFELCQKPEFGQSLFEYLLSKCHHWDRDIRDLVSQSMGRLSTIIDINPYFKELLSKSVSFDLNSRHGSILCMAHIIGNIGPKFKSEFIEGIESIAILLKEKNFLKGMGGEFMKQALSVLIEKCSLVSFPIKLDVLKVWAEIITDAITSEDMKTRKDAICAVPLFCQNYLQNESELKDYVLNRLFLHLNSNKESSRIGSSESLRLMSKEILNEEYFKQCFDIFVVHIKSGDLLCNSRSSEVLALIDLSLKFIPLNESLIQTICQCLCLALNDRSMDSRGDIGGNVRLAAIEASLSFYNNLNENQIIEILKLISTQCVSIWQKERKLAAKAFKQIVFDKELEQIDRQLIKTFFDDMSEDEMDWKPFIHLLRVQLFTYDLWRGIVKCVSNPSETRVRTLLKQELKSTKSHVMEEFLVLFENNLTNDLLSQSCINCSHFLLSSCRTSEEFCKRVLTLTWNCVRRSRDCRKIVSAIDVFCTGIQLSSHFRQSMSYLVIFLCHSFPRIRCQTSNQLYVSLLSIDDINEEAINLLTETDWTQSKDVLRPIRDQICDSLEVVRPQVKSINT